MHKCKHLSALTESSTCLSMYSLMRGKSTESTICAHQQKFFLSAAKAAVGPSRADCEETAWLARKEPLLKPELKKNPTLFIDSKTLHGYSEQKHTMPAVTFVEQWHYNKDKAHKNSHQNEGGALEPGPELLHIQNTFRGCTVCLSQN